MLESAKILCIAFRICLSIAERECSLLCKGLYMLNKTKYGWISLEYAWICLKYNVKKELPSKIIIAWNYFPKTCNMSDIDLKTAELLNISGYARDIEVSADVWICSWTMLKNMLEYAWNRT